MRSFGQEPPGSSCRAKRQEPGRKAQAGPTVWAVVRQEDFSAKDGFFLGGNACRSEASVRSHRKAVPSVFGFHPSGRFAGLEFVEHAPYPVDFTALDDL
jgi:hypothetical protein